MKAHTTNYKNTFIEIADDCPTQFGEIPPIKTDAKTVANMQFEMAYKNPYKFTSDEIIFQVYADRNEISESEYKEARGKYFSKGQPCFRASPLTKRYGWGVHHDKDEKMAIYSAESEEYKKLVNDKTLTIVKAMKSIK